ncbi:MAG: YlxR family protein [Clostridium sp.]|nr:YlxR family protein [Clostridium sp.]
MKKRKIPLRLCLGCMEMKEKRNLIRVVKDKENNISIDLTGKKPGRGAYICKDVECLEKAYKFKRLNSSLKQNISEDIYEELKKEVLGG